MLLVTKFPLQRLRLLLLPNHLLLLLVTRFGSVRAVAAAPIVPAVAPASVPTLRGKEIVSVHWAGSIYMFEKTLTLLPPLLLLDRSLLSRLRLLLRSLNRFKIVFLEETNQQQDFMEHSASVIITQKPINATEIKLSALPLF